MPFAGLWASLLAAFAIRFSGPKRASQIATLDPATNLKAAETYEVRISTGAKDLEGNPLSSQGSPVASGTNYAWRFTVAGPGQ